MVDAFVKRLAGTPPVLHSVPVCNVVCFERYNAKMQAAPFHRGDLHFLRCGAKSSLRARRFQRALPFEVPPGTYPRAPVRFANIIS